MKTILLALVYVYMGLGVYYTFANASFIADTSKIAAAYVIALAADVVVIDSLCAILASLCGK